MKAHEQRAIIEATVGIRTMISEKLFLMNLHSELGKQWRSIADRIEVLDRRIETEKQSVKDIK